MKNNLPLKGVRIIDLSHSWAAPHCTRILADFGAEVIKVEYILRLCLLRGARKEGRTYNTHPAWLQVNRNKLSITLDLKVERDREILTDLIKTCDVFVENSRPGVMKKLGFGYNDVVKIKKDMIMLSMSAFGNTGPYASYSGYGAVFEAVGGIQSLTAYDRNSRPYRIKEMDITNGLAGASAVMTALLHRQQTGQGQYIELSQLEASTHATIGEHLLEYAMNSQQTLPLGNRHWKFAPQGCYRCKGEDKWVVITIRSEMEWQRLCEVLSHPEWISDARFATREARIENHDMLNQLIAVWTSQYTQLEAMEILQSQGIPSGAVLDVSEISENTHLKHRQYFVRDVGGSDKLFMGMPFALNKGSGEIRWRGPDLGQHNEYVLCEMLGRSIDEVKPIQEDEIGTAYDP
jgi:crotonobetainyl-CoA:carnitine CoA-transferase CaiB-like acyl-CoA transferase